MWRGSGDSPPAPHPLGSPTPLLSTPQFVKGDLPFPPPTWPHCPNPWHRRSPAPHMVSPFTLGSPRSTSAGPRASLYPAQLCPAPAPGRATRSSAPSPARPGSELERQPEPSGLPRTRSQAGANHSPRLGDQRLRSDSRAFLLTRGNGGSKGGDAGERNTGRSVVLLRRTGIGNRSLVYPQSFPEAERDLAKA